jgi:thioester reductase-like protein
LVQPEARASETPIATQLPAPAAESGGTVAALRSLIAGLVHLTPARIEPSQPITAHGLDSLMLVELRTAIAQQFDVEVPIAALVKGPSVDELAALIRPAEPVQPRAMSASPPVETVAAERDKIERELRRAVAELLRVSEQRVDPRKSIIAQGMDSLMLTELRARVKERYSIDLPMTMLVKGPSVVGLLEHLHGGAVEQPAARLSAPAPQSGVHADPRLDVELPKDIQPRATLRERSVRRVLVTGATGFLGRHLVSELLRRGADEVCCLVRGESDAAAQARLHAVLEPEVRALPSLRVLHADMEQDQLGLGAARLRELIASSDAVIHNAAIVHFGKSYPALRQANVGSWLSMLREAAVTLPTLHFVSSWAVFSTQAHAGKPAREADWPTQMPSSGYRESKFVAEMLARAAKERGFPVQVHRPALIGLHSQTGESNPKELFSALVTAVVQHGLAPDIDLAVPFAHVDAVAEGMARVVLDGVHTDFNYHWANQHSIDWHALLDWLASEGVHVERMPYNAWRAAMPQRVRGTSLEPFIAWLPETLHEGELGYLDAALRSSQPQPFDTTRTRAAVPKLFDGPAIVAEAWRRFIQRARGSRS